MKISNTEIQDVKLIIPRSYKDYRGAFTESYRCDIFNDNTDKKYHFVQDNLVESKKNVLRGLHYQKKYPQGKLIQSIFGKIYDVAVDIRLNSPTYGRWVGEELSDENKKQLFIPKGFGHAFLTLSDHAIVSYKVDSFYNKNSDAGIKFDDPSINIKWLLDSSDISLSDKDKDLPVL